jgi:hypothetical protein
LLIGWPQRSTGPSRSGCSVSLCLAALTTMTEHVFGGMEPQSGSLR